MTPDPNDPFQEQLGEARNGVIDYLKGRLREAKAKEEERRRAKQQSHPAKPEGQCGPEALSAGNANINTSKPEQPTGSPDKKDNYSFHKLKEFFSHPKGWMEFIALLVVTFYTYQSYRQANIAATQKETMDQTFETMYLQTRAMQSADRM
jgi:hypothetical protein